MNWKDILAHAPPVKLAGVLCRLVESQEQVATNRLVGSLARQSVLEEMLEATKPRLPGDAAKLHYLLATPFRYPPLKHGSRFGKRSEPSLFYGSLNTKTVLAESAYYRFVFWYGMVAPPPGKLDTQHTLFAVEYRTGHGLRLQDPPFDSHREALVHPSDYGPTQALGTVMREAGAHAFEYVSARDPEGGTNVALYTPAALAGRMPASQDAWLCETTGAHVRFHAAHGAEVQTFPIDVFLVRGELPFPA